MTVGSGGCTSPEGNLRYESNTKVLSQSDYITVTALGTDTAPGKRSSSFTMYNTIIYLNDIKKYKNTIPSESKTENKWIAALTDNYSLLVDSNLNPGDRYQCTALTVENTYIAEGISKLETVDSEGNLYIHLYIGDVLSFPGGITRRVHNVVPHYLY